MMRFIFILLLAVNLWVWRIFTFSFLAGFVVVIFSIIFYLHLFERKSALFKLLIVGFLLLFVFQWQFSEPESLTLLSNDQKRIQAMRLREYPPKYLRVGYWFEGRRETIAAFRLLDNFSEVIDPNLYFFANHPRERIGYSEFEKFSYVLLPFFVIGSLSLFGKKKKRKILFLGTIPFLILFSFVGDTSEIGPFALFPFLLVSSFEGIKFSFSKIPKRWKFLSAGAFLLIYLLVFIQTLSYAIY